MSTKFNWLFVAGLVLALSVSGAAGALDLGANVTISDTVNSGTGWYGDREDQEVEPNCLTGQLWDLEGTFLNGTTLSIVAGYNLRNGYQGEDPGDLFFDVTGDVQYGRTNDHTGGDQSYPLITSNTFGYDYVFDVNWLAGTYNIYSLSAGDTTLRVYYNQNEESNPYRYNSGGELIGSGTFTYTTGLTDAQAGGMLGGNHNVAQFDVSFLSGSLFTSHLTMECGNDNLMGQAFLPPNNPNPQPVPEPATVTLLGLGLMVAAGRKALQNRKNNAV